MASKREKKPKIEKVEAEAKEEEEEIVQIGSCTGFKIGQKFATPSPGYGDRL